MATPIEILKRRDFIQRPDKDWGYGWLSVTQTFIDEVKHSNPWEQHEFEAFVAEFMGENIKFENCEQARIVATYLVQEFMKAYNANDNSEIGLDVDAMLVAAHEKAGAYIWRMDHGDLTYMRAKPDEDEFNENAPPVVDDRGNRKRKKGKKKEMAAELYRENRTKITRSEMIALFMEEIGMSKAGATTYFHNNKAEYGPCKET